MPLQQGQQRLPFLPRAEEYRALSPSSSGILSSIATEQLNVLEDEIGRPQSAPQGRILHHKNPKAKPRTSWVYDHMIDADRETRYINAVTGAIEWRCKYCPKVYDLNGGTAVITDHLVDGPSKYGHSLERNSARDSRAKNQQASISAAMNQASENPRKRRRVADGEGASIDQGVLQILWVNVLASCSLALRLVSVPEFRAFLAYLNSDVDVWLPKSHHTIRAWVIECFTNQKEKLKQIIQSARSLIHISCDLWTSPNSLAILGIIAHFINEDGKLQHCVLALKDVIGEHTSENLAVKVLDVVKEWGFASKLGYFMMDNASNNDTMMRALQRGLFDHIL